MAAAIDENGSQLHLAMGADADLLFGEHALQKLYGAGQPQQRNIRALAQPLARNIELVPAIGMKQPIGAHHMAAFIGHVAQKTVDKLFCAQGKGWLCMLIPVRVSNADAAPIVADDALF